jgi:hypothetical protein
VHSMQSSWVGRRGTLRLGAVAFGAALVGGLSPAGAQTPGSQPPSKVTVAIKANENNLTPFTLTLLGLPVTHDLTNLVYDTLFWSQARTTPSRGWPRAPSPPPTASSGRSGCAPE